MAQITNSLNLLKFFADNKDGFSSLESVFTILAIVFGGYWAYRAFHRKRERFPKTKVSHTISYWDVSENERLLRIVLTIINDGEVLLTVSSGFTWVQQMKPWPTELLDAIKSNQAPVEGGETQVRWPLIVDKEFSSDREIEPKESDEIQMDFVLDKWYEQILVYSFIENAAKPGRHMGWDVSSVVTFDKKEEQGTPPINQQIPDKRLGRAKPRPEPATHFRPQKDTTNTKLNRGSLKGAEKGK